MLKNTLKQVAPFTGAWIETYLLPAIRTKFYVAPFTGAWIETNGISGKTDVGSGRSLHGSVD